MALPPASHLVEDQRRDLAPLPDPSAVAAHEPGTVSGFVVAPGRQALQVLAGAERHALSLRVRDLPQGDELSERVLDRVADLRERDCAVGVVGVGGAGGFGGGRGGG